MVEIKYQHPLEYYTVDNFVEESKKLIGEPLPGIEATYDTAKYDFVAAYAAALGDDNPLFHDLWYAVSTRHDGLIAPPTFLITTKYPITAGALYDGPYPLVGFESKFDWVWNDTIKMNDQLTGEVMLKDVYETKTNKGRTINLVSECTYLNSLSEELVATCEGTLSAIAVADSITEIPEAIKEGFRKNLVTDREVYCHSQEEITRILDDIKAMTRRGPKTIFWEDVDVGEPLPPVVKAPLTTGDCVGYVNAVFSAKAFPNFELNVQKLQKNPGMIRSNPTTGWPYDLHISEHVDPFLSGSRGMPYMFGWGTLKAGFCAHILTNWIGDDGFVRNLNVDTTGDYIYGDALWVKGSIVDKYKEKIAGTLYGAVDIKLSAVNQLNQTVATGIATVYLPTTGCIVSLPIMEDF